VEVRAVVEDGGSVAGEFAGLEHFD